MARTASEPDELHLRESFKRSTRLGIWLNILKFSRYLFVERHILESIKRLYQYMFDSQSRWKESVSEQELMLNIPLLSRRNQSGITMYYS